MSVDRGQIASAIDQALVDVRSDKSADRFAGVAILGGFGGTAEVSVIVAMCDDPDRLVRLRAIAALGEIGPNAAAALTFLEILRQNEDREVAKYAAEAIELIRKEFS